MSIPGSDNLEARVTRKVHQSLALDVSLNLGARPASSSAPRERARRRCSG